MSSSDSASEENVGSKETVLKNEFSVMHLLPCDIDYNGPAPVTSYFQISEGKRRNDEMTAHFRGHELIGKKVKLPEKITGLNVTQDMRNQSKELKWAVVGEFKEINVWQHDVAPDVNQIEECLDWFELASAVS